MKSLKEYRRYLRPAALALGAAALLAPAAAFAAGDGTQGTGIVDGVNFLLKFVSILITPFVYLSGWLLSPSWTMGDVIGLRPHLHTMWVLVSNIVYTVFAIALLGIAFVNIFNVGGEKGKYELKSMLPKFVVGILIVPFSWFAVSATLSVANLLTASMLQLPASVINTPGSTMTGMYVPANITIDFSASSTAKAPEAAGPVPPPTGPSVGISEMLATSTGVVQSLDCSVAAFQADKSKCVPIFDAISGQGVYSPLIYYAYGVFHIQDSSIIREGKLKDIKTLADLSMSVAIELLLIVVLFVVTLALFAALAIRAVVLWAYIVFSPMFGLMYFLEGSFKFADKVAEKVSFGKFLSLAFVPVYVSAALSFGMIFMNAATNFQGGTKIEGDGISLTAENGGATFSNGNVTVKMLGGAAVGETKKILDYGLGRLIFSGFALVILYLAVMAALKANDITSMVVEPIDKLAKMAAKSAPILPGGMSIQNAKNASSLPAMALERLDQSRFQELQKKSDSFFGVQNDALRAAQLTASVSAGGNEGAARNMARGMLQAGTAQQFAQRADARRTLAARVKEMNIPGVTDEMLTKLTSANTQAEVVRAVHDIEKQAQLAGKELFEGADSESSILEKMGQGAEAQKATAAKAKFDAPVTTQQSMASAKDPSKRVDVNQVKLDASHTVNVQGGALADLQVASVDDQVKTLAKFFAGRDLTAISKEEVVKYLRDGVGLKNPEAELAKIAAHLEKKVGKAADGSPKTTYEFSDAKQPTKPSDIAFRSDAK